MDKRTDGQTDTQRQTDGQTDGHTLLKRCVEASKNNWLLGHCPKTSAGSLCEDSRSNRNIRDKKLRRREKEEREKQLRAEQRCV